ncbi:lysine--tRNA ligase [Snodgrassella sp. CFCC 13594]|uniref:lysine--tRNA ligase n=1 Tax=Snodgrassella sp. CFCC 13594 TaxID=1775559 RepID=UPI0008322213|nr:lysine--tRNA ligase [Snodgrassella sp. CFCC 13594]
MSEEHNQQAVVLDENQIMALRREKLADLRSKGVAFPNDFRRDAFAGDLHHDYEALSKEELAEKALPVKVAGRMMLKRTMGKASFATIQDMSGQIQLYINNQGIGEEAHNEFKHWDLGDIVGAEGELMKTNHGELTVRVSQIRLLSKSLRPLPDKFHGLNDQEQKYRQRYVDLITNSHTRDTFMKRSRIIQAIRNVMVGNRYLEVETPMMHPIPGGATAKPFVTHHNTLDMDLYLRVAPELYLKRLVVGGLERVFEINRNFRNEGMSTRHNPEFTMMEFYEAYGDYQRMMDMTETVIRTAAIEANGSAVVSYNGQEVDLSQPFARFTILQAIQHFNPQYTEAQLQDEHWLKTEIQRLHGSLPAAPGVGSLQLALFEECAEAKLWQPTFIIDYPVEVSPLARASDTQPGLTERFELFVVGRELANGYSELNDPEDQSARFKAQVAQLDAGDDEAMHYDADYIRAMEYGLPPTGGCGIGIDRLVMLLTDAPSIRDVILFPQMRPE